MNYIEQQKNIKFIRDKFEDLLAKKLNLIRVSAPIFIEKNLGLTDQLSGKEKAIEFTIESEKIICEINHSLAKWKRVALKKYGFKKNSGIYANMNAIRKDENLDEIHSVYVDQWDWEVVIEKKDRNINTLKKYANGVYSAILKIIAEFNKKNKKNVLGYLPKKLFFIDSQTLEDYYPEKNAKEREDLICKKNKAVFIIGIGNKLNGGQKHDDRSPDYDDWNLNGDLLLWNNVIKKAFEISSMGIRVDGKAMEKQLTLSDCLDRLKFQYHQDIINSKLPYTIGGGIGQSRLCMFLLNSKHIGEVQVSVWPKETIKKLETQKIKIL